jgi:flagella basal body P-ring formation protein FlgA
MIIRSLSLAVLAIVASMASALAQSDPDALATPILRANITISGDIVRIGDVIDNAGSASQIAIYRAPDPGTTGSLPASQVIETLRSHNVIGVETRDIRNIVVTRAARTLNGKEIELAVAHAMERRNGFGEAANISVTFDRDLRDVQIDSSNDGDLRATNVRFDPRSSRFDVTFDISNQTGAPSAKLRFTGTVIETVEAAVLTRSIERNETLKASDVSVERRPKAEAGGDLASRDRAVGMQPRRAMRPGQILKNADLAKADLVTRDQDVTLIYQSPGLYLTGRGKAMEAGAEGDTINITNLQSKRTVQAVVVGPGQVAIITRPYPQTAIINDAPTKTAAAEPVTPVAAPIPSSSETGKSE